MTGAYNEKTKRIELMASGWVVPDRARCVQCGFSVRTSAGTNAGRGDKCAGLVFGSLWSVSWCQPAG